MAERKRPETRPQLDRSRADARDLTEREMPVYQFGTVIRFVKNGEISKVLNLKAGIIDAANALGVKPSRTPRGLPKGSDQVDTRSVIEWADRITDQDVAAKNQLAAILATISTRL